MRRDTTTKMLWAGAPPPRVWDVQQPVDPGVQYPVLGTLSSFRSFLLPSLFKWFKSEEGKRPVGFSLRAIFLWDATP